MAAWYPVGGLVPCLTSGTGVLNGLQTLAPCWICLGKPKIPRFHWHPSRPEHGKTQLTMSTTTASRRARVGGWRAIVQVRWREALRSISVLMLRYESRSSAMPGSRLCSGDPERVVTMLQRFLWIFQLSVITVDLFVLPISMIYHISHSVSNLLVLLSELTVWLYIKQ